MGHQIGVDQGLSEAAVPKAASASRPAPPISVLHRHARLQLFLPVLHDHDLSGPTRLARSVASMMPRTLPSGATSNVLTVSMELS